MQKFYTDERVAYADTDAMGIAWHGNYIRWFEIGRTELLRQIGYPYSEMEKLGLWLPVTDVTCHFKKPAYYDDTITIAAWLEKLGGATVVINYEITRKETNEILVTGQTRHGVTNTELKPIKTQKEFPEFYKKVLSTME